MELDAKKLKPGMVLMEDVLGKNGKPIVPKDRVLSEVEIEFIQKFLIENVRVKRTVEDKIITNGTSARKAAKGRGTETASEKRIRRHRVGSFHQSVQGSRRPVQIIVHVLASEFTCQYVSR